MATDVKARFATGGTATSATTLAAEQDPGDGDDLTLAAAAATFAYFGVRYIFFQTTKLYPIQFMGIFLFFLATIGSIVFYKYQLPLSEYIVSFFWLITSIILYQAGKPEFRNYFRHK